MIVKDVAPTTLTTEEEESLYSVTPMAEALNNVNAASICVELQLLKICLKPTDVQQEPENCSQIAVICNSFFCQRVSHKILSFLDMYISDSLQMIWYIWGDSLHFQSLIVNPVTY